MIHPLSLEDIRRKVAKGAVPLATHSGSVVEGGVFVALPAPMPSGRENDAPGGERYFEQVLAAKPYAIVCQPRHLPLLEALGADCNVAAISSVRAALGVLAQSHYGTDEHCPKVVGITGTNGKTTETYLLEALFSSLTHKAGVIGTVSYRWPGHEEEAPLTTPDCLRLHAMLAAMHKAGTDIVFMEVSSHAIDQERVAGINFSGALLTNVTQDHLDYHPDMADYFSAKARLFRSPDEGGLPCADKIVVCNADDDYARTLLAEKPGRIGFGIERAPVPGSRHLEGKILSLSPQGMRLAMEFEGRRWELSSPLVGGFNVQNLLGAQAFGLGFGLGPDDFSALSGFTGVSGRLERVPNQAGLNVFVDYAHTPDALEKAISALRAAGFARIVTLFGCGGNRDRGKRPLMGSAVAKFSDVAVLTSDNPRNEDPNDIIADVLPGLAGCPRVVTEPDRRKALALAVELLSPRDALLVAGKGHETYQLIKGVKYPFSDQAILREILS